MFFCTYFLIEHLSKHELSSFQLAISVYRFNPKVSINREILVHRPTLVSCNFCFLGFMNPFFLQQQNSGTLNKSQLLFFCRSPWSSQCWPSPSAESRKLLEDVKRCGTKISASTGSGIHGVARQDFSSTPEFFFSHGAQHTSACWPGPLKPSRRSGHHCASNPR